MKYRKSFSDEIEAAKFYDTYVLLAFGKDARTNETVRYDDVKHMSITEFMRDVRDERDLPKHISFCTSRNVYEVQIGYRKKYHSQHPTIEEAIEALQNYKNIIADVKVLEKEEHYK